MREENFEYLKLHLMHPKDWGKTGSKKEANLMANDGMLNDMITHASEQGWEIKSTSVIEKSDGSAVVEYLHMQRSSLHPNYGTETFSDTYMEDASKGRADFIKSWTKE